MRWFLVIALVATLPGSVFAQAALPALSSHPKVEWALLAAVTGRSDGASGIHTGHDAFVLAVVETRKPDPGTVAELVSRGARVVGIYGNLIKAWLPGARLYEIAGLPPVQYIRRPLVPNPLEFAEPRLATEGVALLGATLFHAKGVLGQGVRVGVIDVGFAALSHAVRAGEIDPGSVVWTRDYTGQGIEGPSAHGTAVVQVVHNIAPRASLYLAAVADEVDLGQAVADCIAQGVDILVHSVGWVNTEFGDGTGVVSELVKRAASAGVLWVNAAGNHAQRHWLGTPRVGGEGWVEFEPGVRRLELVVEMPGLVQVALTWDEWPQAVSDFDLYLEDAGGTVVAMSRSEQSGEAPPAEFVSYFADRGRYRVGVRAVRVERPVAVRIFSLGHDLQPYVARSSILTPGNAQEAFTVGAVGLRNWTSGPQQPYSSQGPTYDGRIKPDLVGLDGVTNFVYPVFWGTSAAAPHVAGMAALLLCQARLRGEAVDPAGLRALLGRWAVDLGDPGPDPVYGEGRLRVYVEETHAQRTVSGPTGPGGSVTVWVTVRMPSTQVGGVELRETVPVGMQAVVEEAAGATVGSEGGDLVWRWVVLHPGEERRVAYRVTVPPGHPPGRYEVRGVANGDPVRGEGVIVVDGGPALPLRVVSAPNPAPGSGPVSFTPQGLVAVELRLWVYDLSGRVVYDSGWQPGPTYQWNLQDDRGRVVAGGVYLYWVEVRTEDGRSQRSGLGRLLVVR